MPTYFENKFGKWIGTKLRVAYRASDAPQILTIDLALNAPSSRAWYPVNTLVRLLPNGGTAGSMFDPARTEGKLVQGEIGGSGAKFHWEIEHRCLDPKFLRWTVEEMALVNGRGQDIIDSFAITGSLPLDDSPYSVREADVRSWFDDPDAFPGWAAQLPFAVTLEAADSSRDARGRVTFARALDKESYAAFKEMWVFGSAVIAAGWDAKGAAAAFAPPPNFAQAGVEVTFDWPTFDARPRPALGIWLNMLARFHGRVPVESIQLRLAGL